VRDVYHRADSPGKIADTCKGDFRHVRCSHPRSRFDTVERIADHPINQIEELLPWNLLVKMPQLRIAA